MRLIFGPWGRGGWPQPKGLLVSQSDHWSLEGVAALFGSGRQNRGQRARSEGRGVGERGWPTSLVSLILGYRTYSAEMLPGPVQAASTMSRIGFLVGRERGRRALPLVFSLVGSALPSFSSIQEHYRT